jgi:hypothetical protein
LNYYIKGANDMLKLDSEDLLFIENNAPKLLKYFSNESISDDNISDFLEDFYDWIDEYGFDEKGYYNYLGDTAQKIYDYVFQNSQYIYQ